MPEALTVERATGSSVRTWRTYTLRRLLLVSDAIAIAVALGLALKLAGAHGRSIADLGWGLLSLPVWALLFKTYGLYDRDDKRISHSTVDDVPWVFHVLVVGSLGLWAFYRVSPYDELILAEGLSFFGLGFVGVLSNRAIVRALARLTTAPERVLIVGGGPMAELLLRKMVTHPEYRLNPVGYLDGIAGVEPPRGAGDLPHLGDVHDLAVVCRVAEIDRVLISPSVDEAIMLDLIRQTRGLDVRVSIVPNVVDVLGPAVEIDDVEGITVLGINPPEFNRSSRVLKRGMDIAIAAGALLLSAPIIALCAIAVRLDSPGPAFFAQERVGREGRRFRLFKLRTMELGADARTEELRVLSADPAWLLLDHDPRITRVGRFLRHTSLDELPQLLCVLRGDMSLVGPRPLTPRDQGNVTGWGERRLDLTPGITGLWQVLGRTTIPFDEMVKLDYLYVTNWSLWGDVRLLLRTLPAVLRRRGVN